MVRPCRRTERDRALVQHEGLREASRRRQHRGWSSGTRSDHRGVWHSRLVGERVQDLLGGCGRRPTTDLQACAVEVNDGSGAGRRDRVFEHRLTSGQGDRARARRRRLRLEPHSIQFADLPGGWSRAANAGEWLRSDERRRHCRPRAARCGPRSGLERPGSRHGDFDVLIDDPFGVGLHGRHRWCGGRRARNGGRDGCNRGRRCASRRGGAGAEEHHTGHSRGRRMSGHSPHGSYNAGTGPLVRLGVRPDLAAGHVGSAP